MCARHWANILFYPCHNPTCQMGKLRPGGHAAGRGSKESEQLCWTPQDLLSFPQHPGKGEMAASVSH